MKLLITDLDNTLYDWVTYFATSFGAMVRELTRVLPVGEAQLLSEFKAVHRRYGNSEQPFAVFELESVCEKFGGASRAELLRALDGPLSAFRAARERHLRLYPGVRETLRALRERGVLVVGHTEAIAVNAFYRLNKLGVIEFFHHIYALEGRLEPHPDPARGEFYRVPPGLISVVPRHERKPNPELLRDICRKEGVEPSEACYVGDSLTRDVAMAKNAGVLAVWAEYGTRYERRLWDLLVRVTHWTEEDVKREEELRLLSQHIKPDRTIAAFGELMEIFGLPRADAESAEAG